MKALKDALPVMLGYFFVSIAFGIIAKELIGFNAVLMSALVFAGASQFIALQMLMNKANGYLIVLTTFFVNLRHILMSTYLSRFYRGVSVVKRFLVSFGITDETFAIAVKRFREGKADWLYNLKLNILCYISWVSGTVVGLLFGYLIPLSLVDVFSFCLVALFIFIATASVEKKFDVVVAVIAGIVAILLSSLPKGWNIILACLVGCLVGGVYEWRSQR
jgi:4-azaleucine resistance transporter AzlC